MSGCSETKLTWDELATLDLVVRCDLAELEQLNSYTEADVLGELVKGRKSLLAKLDVMRVEAYRRERGEGDTHERD